MDANEFKFVVDIHGKPIERGDVVVCLEPIDGYLVYGGLYTVAGVIQGEGRIIIDPDLSSKEGHFRSTRFEIVDLSNLY